MPKNDYKNDLLGRLRDPEYAAGYLSAAMTESAATFLLALRDVAEAEKGMTKVASEAGVNRENLYRMLSDEGNPRLSSLDAVLDTLGFRMVLEAKHAANAPSEAAPQQRGNRSTQELPHPDLGGSQTLLEETSCNIRGLWTTETHTEQPNEFAVLESNREDYTLFFVPHVASGLVHAPVERFRKQQSWLYEGKLINKQNKRVTRDFQDRFHAPSIGFEPSKMFKYECFQPSTGVAFKKEGVYQVCQTIKQSQKADQLRPK